MKKIFLPSVIATAFLFSAFVHDPIVQLEIGKLLPNGSTKLKDVMGNELVLQNAKKENGLLVVFSCNTCPFVVKQESSILETGRVAKESNIGYVIINSNEAQRSTADSPEEMKKYAQKQGYDFPYTIDHNSTLADAFGATRTPEAFLFDKDLKLVYRGAFSDDTDPKMAKVFYLKDALIALRDGKPIATSTTKSVGCTIKRALKPHDH